MNPDKYIDQSRFNCFWHDHGRFMDNEVLKYIANTVVVERFDREQENENETYERHYGSGATSTEVPATDTGDKQ